MTRFLLPFLLLASPAGAATILAGAGQGLPSPSEAARAAAPGDTVLIEPGTYFDCIISETPRLTIAGKGPGVVLTDKACEGKALLVLRGDGTVVRDLTLARARVGDNNGAGIRHEGRDLTVERVRFENNQVALLSGVGVGRITMTDCVVEGGGVGGERPGAAIAVGRVETLRITGGRIAAAQGGQILSEAQHTVIRGTAIDTGPAATGIVVRGALDLQDATLTAGPAAVAGIVRVEGDGMIELRRNRLVNQAHDSATLLQNWGGATPFFADNAMDGGDVLQSTTGAWRNRVSTLAHGAWDGVRGLAGGAKRGVLGLVR